MDTVGKRLKWARARAKLERPIAAERTKMPYSTLADYENDRRGPSRENAKALGRLYKVPWDWILEGPAGPPPAVKEPASLLVKGEIGAGRGNEVEPIDDLNEPIELPPSDAIAVRVRGNSMWPVYKDGEKLVYLPEQRSPEELVGRECAIKVRGGGMMVKIIRKGSRKNRYNLESFNEPTIENVAVEWASPIRWRVY